MLSKTKITLIILLTTLIISSSQMPTRRHLLNSTVVDPNRRTDTLFARCPVVRKQFYAMQKNESQSYPRTSTASQIGLNGDALIYSLITKNQSGVRTEVDKSIGGIVVYFVFFLIGIALIIILAPILICCCCRPYNCPPCMDWRKMPQQPYSGLDMKWPAIVIGILCLIVIGSLIAALVFNPNLQKGYSETRCSVAMIFDDLLYGNYTQDGKDYFMGLNPLGVNLSVLASKAEGLLQSLSNFDDGGKLLNYVVDKIRQVKHDVSDIPRGDGSEQMLELNYVSPLNSIQGKGANSNTINSTFNQILGSKDQSTSMVGSSYAGLSMAQHGLTSLSDLSEVLSQGLPKLQQSINSTFRQYAALVTTVQDLDKSADKTFSDIQQKGINPILIATYIIFSLTILFALIILICAIFIACCQKFSFRKIMYPSCVTIAILGILLFLITLLMSAGTVATHYGCHYIDVGLQTKAEFKYRFGPFFNNTILTNLMAQCATQEGTGILTDQPILGEMLGIKHQQGQEQEQEQEQEGGEHKLGNGVDLGLIGTGDLGNVSQFGVQELLFVLDKANRDLKGIQGYTNGEVMDIDSIKDLEILQRISDPTKYTCSSPGFASDSWVPSVSQSSVYIPCKNPLMAKVNKDTCKTKQDFQTRNNNGCTGCIDTFSIFSQFNNKQQVTNSLKKRYPSPDCQQFTTQLSSIWQNFYYQKQQAIPPAHQRSKAAQQKLSQLSMLISQSFQQNFTMKQTHLQPLSQTPSVIPASPLSQAVSRLNCKVLGQDLQLTTNTFCTQVFNYTYQVRIVTIIASFAILLLIIFVTVLGMRAFRMERLKANQGIGLPPNSDTQGQYIHPANSGEIGEKYYDNANNTNNGGLGSFA